MRQIGTLPNESQARQFADFLLTQGIRSQAEPADGGWALWVYDEDKVTAAKGELTRYREQPADPRYAAAVREAERIRTETIAREKAIERKIVDVRSQWTQPNANRPVTMLLIGLSILVTFLTNFGDGIFGSREDELFRRLTFANYNAIGARIFYYPIYSAGFEVWQGEVWRLVTPIFLHMRWYHLLFNMLGTHSVAGVIEMRRGSWRLALMVLLIAVTSNTAQFLWSGPQFGGMSGVVFGLFGYVWMKSRFDPSAGMYIDPASVSTMLMFLVLCMTGILGSIANAAHLVGLGTGVVIGYTPVLWRQVFGR